MKKVLSVILTVAMISALIVLPTVAANEDVVLTIVPNVTSVDESENAVDVIYTLTVKPKAGVKIGAFSVKLNPPADMTLAETEVMEQSGDGFWINFDLKYIPRFQPNGIFETAYEYAPAIKTLNAAGGTEARAMTSEAVVMTIKATIAAGKSGEFVLDADFTVADPLGNGISNVVVESTPVTVGSAHTHTEEDIPAVAPTCTETGLTAGKKCSVCGEILVAQTEVEKVAHTEETIPAKDATCTETGLTAGKKCSVCGEILVDQETTEKVAHTWVGDTCSVCGEVKGEHPVSLGDVDSDGDVDARDAALAYGIFNEKVTATAQQQLNADVDGDSDVDARDAALIYAFFNGKIEAFPAE